MVLWTEFLSPSAQHISWHKKGEPPPMHLSIAPTPTSQQLYCTPCPCSLQAVFYVAGHTGVLLNLEENRQCSLKCHVS